MTAALRGASWGSDESIIFATASPAALFRVPAAGGEPEKVASSADGNLAYWWPEILPGGRAILFSILTATLDAQIAVLDFDTGEQKILIPGGSNPRYVSTGHIVYGVDGTLRAVGFDADRLETVGDPVPVMDGVITKGTGAANFSVSSDGALIYVPGRAQNVAAERTLIWVNREGTEEPLVLDAGAYEHPQLSPDGARLALEIVDAANTDIWIYDLERDTLTRLTFDPAVDERPRWTLDGQRVVFASGRDGLANLFWKAADGTGEVERLTESQTVQAPYSWSSDGTQLLITDGTAISMLSMEGERSVEPLLQAAAAPRYPAISPDGRWMAYKSLESGQDEVYVRPFPDVNSGRWQISPNLGDDPIWSRDGRELFYRGPGGELMAVPVETEPTFRPGNPEALFGGPYLEGGGVQYDVAPDGQRFLMIKESAEGEVAAAPTQIHVVLNWLRELQARVPVPCPGSPFWHGYNLYSHPERVI